MLNVALAVGMAVGPGCHREPVGVSAVVTQAPVGSGVGGVPVTLLDARYPLGSRVVVVSLGAATGPAQVLSAGLEAAGDPVVSADGLRVVFSGKARGGQWQLYEATAEGGVPRQLTSLEGGAMSPALLPDGAVVFASPVPRLRMVDGSVARSSLHVRGVGGVVRRLSFGVESAGEPTVLADGRVLFVSTPLRGKGGGGVGGARLATLNCDGTEWAVFAADVPGGVQLGRPRQLRDGRLVYLVGPTDPRVDGGGLEAVRMARPFQSRGLVPTPGFSAIHSYEAGETGELWVGLRAQGSTSAGGRQPLVLVWRKAGMDGDGEVVVGDAGWEPREAVAFSAGVRPMGRISSVDLAQRTGRILCLDINRSRDGSGKDVTAVVRAKRVRIMAETPTGVEQALGEVAVQEDGSFMAEVPADVSIGFEALDANGVVLRREAPGLWVRPGENRSCVGCHEPPNRSPRNHRPMAAGVPVPVLGLAGAKSEGGGR